MKKKLCLLAVLSALLCACSPDTSIGITENMMSEGTSLESIDDYRCYDTNTGVVYIFVKQETGHRGFGFMTPYISENGLFCKYVNGSITEITETVSSGLQSIGMGLYYDTNTNLIYKSTGIEGFVLFRDENGVLYKYEDGKMLAYTLITDDQIEE